MTTLTIVRGSTSLVLARTDESYAAGLPFWIEAEDGLGMAPLRRLEERGPQQHGVTDVGYRLDPRTVTLVLGFQGDSLADFYNRRDQLLRLLRPTNSPLQLRWELDNGQRRAIDCHVVDGPRMGSSERMGLAQRIGVSLRAADPTFYDWIGISEVYGVGAGSSGWAIPWALPWAIGTASLSGGRSITNPGSFDAWPRIIVRGPIDDLVITNQTTGEVLDFTGSSFDASTTITIDTRYGVKSVTDQAGVNQIDELSEESDLASWHLAADPDAPDGVNTVTVSGSGATTATEVFLQFFPRFIGF